ncbi:hypothetical protein [Thermosipho atlanticus]|uniref:Uncharacterized protein n=1 Tax=Thermosipho atlanticus DSM 15807 TaxID=1123380 RepID=A0A1M5T3N1_9BACT|nr:hypothetical protein [Thermosipho atlanticus]SHH45357.1 hypothetical protein SAMN02745199_1151 [Thermosipho atlanticus DSM 15807]
MKKLYSLIILFILVSLGISNAISFEHATIYYPKGYEKLAIKIGNKFESIRKYVIDIFSFDPGKINIFIEPNTVITNGYANYLQNNTIKLYTWHPTGLDYTYLPLDDWYTFLLIHEFTHLVTLRKLKGLNRICAELKMPYVPNFGKFSYEAFTVFSESSHSENSGRLNNPNISDELFKTFDKTLPNDSLMNDFRYGLVNYNANGGFLKYLIDKYGVQKVRTYIENSMNWSYSWPELMLNFSFPYISSFRLLYLIQNPFKSIFGISYKKSIEEWLDSLKDTKTPGKLVYKGVNERIYKIETINNELYILSSSFGAVSGYFNHPINKLTIISKNGVIKKRIYLSANDFKVEKNNIYILKYGDNNMEIWNVTQNKKLASGKISAFDVYNGKLVYSLYNDMEDISIIKGLDKDFRVNGFIRNLAFTGEKLYYLVGNSLWKFENGKANLIDNFSLKGAFLKKKDKDVYLVSKINGKMEFVKVGTPFIKISNNLNIIDASIDGELFFVTYLQNKPGMGVYKTQTNHETVENKILEIPKTHNYKYKSLSQFDEYKYALIPSVFAPFFFTNYFLPISPYDLGISGWIAGALFDFTNTNNDFFIAPYISNFSTYEPYNNEYIESNYNSFGFGYGIITQNLNKNNIISINLSDFKNSIHVGVTSFSIEILNSNIGFNKRINLQINGLTNYLLNNTVLKLDGKLSVALNYSSENFSFGIGEINNFAYDGTTTNLSPSFYIGVLNFISQQSYLYGNVSFDFEGLNIYGVSINNIFSFYKQSGIGIGYIGHYNFNNVSKSSNNFILYSYIGHPKSNIMYLQAGIIGNLKGEIKPFIGLGTSPHNISAILY